MPSVSMCGASGGTPSVGIQAVDQQEPIGLGCGTWGQQVIMVCDAPLRTHVNTPSARLVSGYCFVY